MTEICRESCKLSNLREKQNGGKRERNEKKRRRSLRKCQGMRKGWNVVRKREGKMRSGWSIEKGVARSEKDEREFEKVGEGSETRAVKKRVGVRR